MMKAETGGACLRAKQGTLKIADSQQVLGDWGQVLPWGLENCSAEYFYFRSIDPSGFKTPILRHFVTVACKNSRVLRAIWHVSFWLSFHLIGTLPCWLPRHPSHLVVLFLSLFSPGHTSSVSKWWRFWALDFVLFFSHSQYFLQVFLLQ